MPGTTYNNEPQPQSEEQANVKPKIETDNSNYASDNQQQDDQHQNSIHDNANASLLDDQISDSPLNLYHEKQRKKLCALHSLNNLLQTNSFTQVDLDEICLRLSPDSRFLNPHRTLLGLGNYDVNVIMAALQNRGLRALWFDQRKNPRCLNMNNITGFILNVDNLHENSSLFNIFNPANLFSSRKHWIAFRKIGDQYYNLDSKLNAPEVVGQEDEMIKLLCDKLSSGDCQVLLVVDKKVAEEHSYWLSR